MLAAGALPAREVGGREGREGVGVKGGRNGAATAAGVFVQSGLICSVTLRDTILRQVNKSKLRRR